MLDESIIAQYKVLVLDIWIIMRFRKTKYKLDHKMNRWQLESNQRIFVDRVIHETNWKDHIPI